MKKEIRTVVYDDELKIEACRFEGIVQIFPNHFHEYYATGFGLKSCYRFFSRIYPGLLFWLLHCILQPL